MKESIIKTKYYEAPISHTQDDPPYCDFTDPQECKFCRTETKYGYRIDFKNECEEDNWGCVNCLINKKFSIYKETDIGDINAEGEFFEYSSKKPYPEIKLQCPKNITEEQIKEIIHTPNISCLQDNVHPTHCKDFMKYIGRWSPENFVNNSLDGNGEKLFKQMLDNQDFDHLWRDTEKENNGTNKTDEFQWAYGALVYVYECIHCNTKECSWDMG